MSKVTKVHRLLCLLFVVPAVSPLIISSVYAGRKKFKTFSFDTPLLPSIVKVEPNKLHLTFRQNKYLKTPNFKIEGTIPLKAPTIVRELMKVDPTNPKVTSINFGDLDAIPEANQHVTYDDTINQPVFVEPPKPLLSVGAHWKPMSESPTEFGRVLPRNPFPSHHLSRRESQNFFNRFDPNATPNFANHNLDFQTSNHPSSGAQYQYMQTSPNLYGNYFNSNSGHRQPSYPIQSSAAQDSIASMPFSPQFPTPQHTISSQAYPPSDMTASPSSYGPPKFESAFNPSNHQSNKWIPIESSPSPSSPIPVTSHFNAQKKLNIGEHYNPSASYLSEKMVEKPTYDPEEAEPDEGSISFSISGPHGGEEVPVGYGEKVKAMHDELKEHPEHLPPGLNAEQLSKYYSHHTFTDALKSNYGFKPAFGPLGFLKSKLKSWKNILS